MNDSLVNQFFLENSLQLVVVTEGLTGHRLKWLEKLTQLLGKVNQPLRVVTLEESQKVFSDKLLSQIEADIVDFIFVNNRNALFPTAEKLFASSPNVQFVIWDADDWLFKLLKTPIPFRALAIRPYLTEIKSSAIIKFTTKNLLYTLINMRKNGKLAKLSVPLAKSIFRRKHWIEDDLTVHEMRKVTPAGKRFTDSNSNTLLIPGFISARKRPELAISVVHALNSVCSTHWQLIFMGKIDPKCAEIIKEARGDHIMVIDKYMDDSTYQEILASVDIVLLLYKNRGASGIAVESCLLGTPVVMAYSRLWKGVERELPQKFRLVRLRVEKIVDAILELSKERQGHPDDLFVVSEILKLSNTREGITQFFIS